MIHINVGIPLDVVERLPNLLARSVTSSKMCARYQGFGFIISPSNNTRNPLQPWYGEGFIYLFYFFDNMIWWRFNRHASRRPLLSVIGSALLTKQWPTNQKRIRARSLHHCKLNHLNQPNADFLMHFHQSWVSRDLEGRLSRKGTRVRWGGEHHFLPSLKIVAVGMSWN